MLNLDKQARDKLAQALVAEIEASETAKGTLPRRWKRNEDLYHVVPRISNINVVNGMEPYTVPLWTQKCDRIVASVYSNLTSLAPYVQVLDESNDAVNADEVERSLMSIAKRGGFDQVFKKALIVTANTNAGTLRARPISETGKVTKVAIDRIHPRHMMCYPSTKPYGEAKSVGHCFYEMLYTIQAKMARGEFFEEPELAGGDDPKERDDAMGWRQGTSDLTEETAQPSRRTAWSSCGRSSPIWT